MQAFISPFEQCAFTDRNQEDNTYDVAVRVSQGLTGGREKDKAFCDHIITTYPSIFYLYLMISVFRRNAVSTRIISNQHIKKKYFVIPRSQSIRVAFLQEQIHCFFMEK